jgi:hypothetical protein
MNPRHRLDGGGWVRVTGTLLVLNGLGLGAAHTVALRVVLPDGCEAAVPEPPSVSLGWFEYGPAPGALLLTRAPSASSSSVFGDFVVQPTAADTFVQVRRGVFSCACAGASTVRAHTGVGARALSALCFHCVRADVRAARLPARCAHSSGPRSFPREQCMWRAPLSHVARSPPLLLVSLLLRPPPPCCRCCCPLLWQYSLDGSQWAHTTHSFRVGPLATGSHSVSVRAVTPGGVPVDPAGAPGPLLLLHTWNVVSASNSTLTLTDVADGVHSLRVVATSLVSSERSPQVGGRGQ